MNRARFFIATSLAEPLILAGLGWALKARFVNVATAKRLSEAVSFDHEQPDAVMPFGDALLRRGGAGGPEVAWGAANAPC